MRDRIPIAQIASGELCGESGSGARCNGQLVKLPKSNNGVVGPAETDVQLWHFLACYTARVGDGGGDGEEDVVEAWVAAWCAARGQNRLRGAVVAAGGEGVVDAVLRVLTRCRQGAGVEVRVDVRGDLVEVGGEHVVGGVV